VTFRLISPCTTFDLAEVVARVTPAQMGMYRGQLAAGLSFALRDGFGVAVACGGYVASVDPGTGLAWFAVNPERGPKLMRPILRAIALTLQRQPYPCVVIATETPAGQRMALALGFVADEQRKEWFHVRRIADDKGAVQAG
jgi:hypothetical protein